MMAAWMVYGVLVSGLLAGGALLAERALRERRLPSRIAWLAAIGLSFALPLGATLRAERPELPSVASLHSVGFGEPRADGSILQNRPVGLMMDRMQDGLTLRSLDEWLLRGWLAMSIVLAGFVAMSSLSLHRRLRHAPVQIVSGMPVVVVEEVGPAVAGFWNPRIIIPKWLLATDESTRALAIAHERQHVAAWDPQLLGCLWLVLVAVPWNLPLWWQARRLRKAIEIDCDARVLAKAHARNYGAALIAVAERACRTESHGMLSSTSFLEARIRTMFAKRHEWSGSRSLGFAFCAVMVLVATTGMTAPEVRSAVHARGTPTDLPLLPSPVAYAEAEQHELAAAIQYYHPRVRQLRAFERADIWVVANENGALIDSSLDVVERGAAAGGDVAEEFARRFGMAAGGDRGYFSNVFAPGEVAPGIVNLNVTVRHAAVADESGPRFSITPMSMSRPVMESRVVMIAAAQRSLIERFDADTIGNGLPPGQEMWFLLDASGVALRAGRRSVIDDPGQAKADLTARYPGISVGYVARGTAVQGPDGRRLAVTWHWLDRESTLPQPVPRTPT